MSLQVLRLLVVLLPGVESMFLARRLGKCFGNSCPGRNRGEGVPGLVGDAVVVAPPKKLAVFDFDETISVVTKAPKQWNERSSSEGEGGFYPDYALVCMYERAEINAFLSVEVGLPPEKHNDLEKAFLEVPSRVWCPRAKPEERPKPEESRWSFPPPPPPSFFQRHFFNGVSPPLRVAFVAESKNDPRTVHTGPTSGPGGVEDPKLTTLLDAMGKFEQHYRWEKVVQDESERDNTARARAHARRRTYLKDTILQKLRRKAYNEQQTRLDEIAEMLGAFLYTEEYHKKYYKGDARYLAQLRVAVDYFWDSAYHFNPLRVALVRWAEMKHLFSSLRAGGQNSVAILTRSSVPDALWYQFAHTTLFEHVDAFFGVMKNFAKYKSFPRGKDFRFNTEPVSDGMIDGLAINLWGPKTDMLYNILANWRKAALPHEDPLKEAFGDVFSGVAFKDVFLIDDDRANCESGKSDFPLEERCWLVPNPGADFLLDIMGLENPAPSRVFGGIGFWFARDVEMIQKMVQNTLTEKDILDRTGGLSSSGVWKAMGSYLKKKGFNPAEPFGGFPYLPSMIPKVQP